MIGVKISQYVTILLFIFTGICFGQQVLSNEIDKTKPNTIRLMNGKSIKQIIASDNELDLFISDMNGNIQSYDLESLEQNWSTDVGGISSSNIVDEKDHIYMVTTTFSDNLNESDKRSFLYAIDKESGVTTKKIMLSVQAPFYLFNTESNLLIVSSDGCVLSYGLFDTEQLSQIFCSDSSLIYRPFFELVRSELYLVHIDKIVKLSFYEKLHVEIISFKNVSINSFAVSNLLRGTIISGYDSGTVFALSQSDSDTIWRFRTGGKISGILTFNDKIIVSSYDNFVYCLKEKDGEIIWKKRFPGRVTDTFKISENEFGVRSTYGNELFVLDVISGSTIERFILPDNFTGETIVIGTARLIIIANSNSIEIYKKN